MESEIIEKLRTIVQDYDRTHSRQTEWDRKKKERDDSEKRCNFRVVDEHGMSLVYLDGCPGDRLR